MAFEACPSGFYSFCDFPNFGAWVNTGLGFGPLGGGAVASLGIAPYAVPATALQASLNTELCSPLSPPPPPSLDGCGAYSYAWSFDPNYFGVDLVTGHVDMTTTCGAPSSGGGPFPGVGSLPLSGNCTLGTTTPTLPAALAWNANQLTFVMWLKFNASAGSKQLFSLSGAVSVTVYATNITLKTTVGATYTSTISRRASHVPCST